MKMFLYSARALALDMASTLAFLATMLLTRNVVQSVATAMALGVGQIAWRLARKQPVDVMQGMSLFLVLATGMATLLTRDPRFVMIKPSLIYVIVGIVMLRPGWMIRYMPPIAVQMAPDVATVFGYAWAGLMFASAALNLVLAVRLGPVAWAGFMSTYAIVSKAVLFLAQFAIMRIIGRRRWRAAHTAEPFASLCAQSGPSRSSTVRS